MKGYLFILFCLWIAFSHAEEKKVSSTRSYTEKEFLDAVEKEVKNRMEKYGSENMVSLTREIMKKEREIELEQQKNKQKQTELIAIEKDLKARIKEFQNQQQKLLGCLDDNDQKQTKRVNHMVEVVSGMRPATAADVLSVQDVDIAVRILGKLEAVKVSKIFNSMDKEISARLQKQFMNMKK
jgi:flagellar motility protein MotE (MotC chaperone)